MTFTDFIRYLVEQDHRFLIVFFILVILDMLTGVINAVLKKELLSSEFREGLMKKILEWFLVILGYSLDFALELTYIGHGVIYALIVMEAYSILENIQDYVPIPDFLKKFLAACKESKDGGVKDENKN